MTVDPEHWSLRALCRHEGHPSDWDDSLDLPDEQTESERSRTLRHRRAKAVCARCPVRAECMDLVDMQRDSGIWFGIHLEAWRKERERAGLGRAENLGRTA